jgi:triacylglycerol lipase
MGGRQDSGHLHRRTETPWSLVVLVHGFLRTGLSMQPMARGLRERGFDVRTITQLNLYKDIPVLGDELHRFVRREQDEAATRLGYRPDVHFVTHSMGGIVVRSMLARHEVPGPNRVVMLAPPNQGSRFAAHMRANFRFPWGDFDPLRKLLPGERGQCEGAGDPDAVIGVIAGRPAQPSGFPWAMSEGDGPFSFAPAADGAHDGKVAIEETKLDSADDFLVLPYGHTWIMARPEVVRQAAWFLREGRFKRP